MMSFFQAIKNKLNLNNKETKQQKIFNKTASLRANQNSLEDAIEKKISWNTLFAGSMTVEAALIVPIFMFAILNMLSIVDIVRMQANIQAAMYETNKKLAVYGYAYDHITDKMDIETGSLVSELFAHTVVKSNVNDIVGEEYLDHSMIRGGSDGIYYIRSDIMEEGDLIDLIARYQVGAFFQIAPFRNIYMLNRCRMHAWTGYEIGEVSAQADSEEMVYVAEYASVYHETPDCTHLRLSIQATTKENVKTQRNIYNQKYTPCEKCGNKNNSKVLYITDMGNRYHTSLACGGLKRTISKIPISQIGNLPPCSKCSS